MKKYTGKLQAHAKQYHKLLETVVHLQDSGEVARFYKRVGIPPDGFSTKEEKCKWEEKTFSDKGKNEAYKEALQELLKVVHDEAERDAIEECLVSGDPLVIVAEPRMKEVYNPKTKKIECWLRIDGLTRRQVMDYLQEAELMEPSPFRPDTYQPNQRPSVFRYKRVRDLKKKGLSFSKIANKLTEVQQSQPNSDADATISVESIKRIYYRGKDIFKKPLKTGTD